jgi:hypothetical protein
VSDEAADEGINDDVPGGEPVTPSEAVSAFAVVASVNEATLQQLLAIGSETHFLDYKASIDLSDRNALIEFVRDVACLAATADGGYLLVGVHDDGSASGQVTEDHLRHLDDEAKIREKVRPFLPDTIQFLVRVHSYEASTLVLIYVYPSPDGVVLFKQRGEKRYADGTKKVRFEQHDLLTRRGTQNVHMTQQELHDAVERAVRRRADEELDARIVEFAKNYATAAPYLNASNRLVAESGVPGEAHPEASPEPVVSRLAWDVPLETLADQVTTAITIGQTNPLKLMLLSTKAVAEQALTDESAPLTIPDLLDRIVTIAGVAAALDDKATFDQALRALSAVYQSNFTASGHRRHDTAVAPTVVWLETLTRVYALGGLLVRLERWSWIRDLVLTGPIVGEMEWYGNWIRHALTEAAREERFRDTTQEPPRDVPLIPRAVEVAGRLSALRPDQYIDSPAATAVIRDSVFKFDALVALVAMQAGGAPDGRYFYTNFIHGGDPSTIRPFLHSLVGDAAMREALGLTDEADLADGVRAVLEMASKQREANAWMRSWRMPQNPLDDWIETHATRGPVV